MHRTQPVEPATKTEEVPVHEKLRKRYATLKQRYPHIRDMASVAELEGFATASILSRYPPET